VECLEEDYTSNDFVGSCGVAVAQLTEGNGVDEWFELRYEGESAGKVHLRTEFMIDETEEDEDDEIEEDMESEYYDSEEEGPSLLK